MEYAIYTRWLAYELRTRGFKFKRTEVNRNFPQYIVWIFENSKELQETLTALTKAKQQ